MTAAAPSSTANLGPGFDVFGLALDAFSDEVTLTRKGSKVTITAADGLPTDPVKNTAGVVAEEMREECGIRDGVQISIKKGVPAGFGMGSSAASAAAAAAAFDGLFDLGLNMDELVRFAGRGERASAGTTHYDNVAASLLGGFVIVRQRPFRVIRIRPPEDLVLCVAIPSLEVPPEKTRISRGAVPNMVDIAKHTENLSSAAGVVAGFAAGDAEMIGESVNDVIVEPARLEMIPGFARVKNGALHAGALGVAISGAGPSVIAFAKGTEKVGDICSAMRHGFADVGCRTITCRPSDGAHTI